MPTFLSSVFLTTLLLLFLHLPLPLISPLLFPCARYLCEIHIHTSCMGFPFHIVHVRWSLVFWYFCIMLYIWRCQLQRGWGGGVRTRRQATAEAVGRGVRGSAVPTGVTAPRTHGHTCMQTLRTFLGLFIKIKIYLFVFNNLFILIRIIKSSA